MVRYREARFLPDGETLGTVSAVHNFGAGDYAYFAEPLPKPVAALRVGLYAGLAPIANRMMAELGREARMSVSGS